VTTTVETATTARDLPQAAALPADDVLVRLAMGPDGLAEDEAWKSRKTSTSASRAPS